MNDNGDQNTNPTLGAGQNGGEPQNNPAANTPNDNPQGGANNNPPADNNNQGAAPTNPGEGAQGGNNPKQPGTIDYNFEGVQMPEGFTLSPEENAKFIDVIKDMGLSNEQASAIVKYGGEYAERIANQIYDLQTQEVKQWGEDAKKALGADLAKTQGLCDTACRKLEAMYPGIGIREALNDTGAGNKLAIVRAMAKLGELLSEDPGKAAGTGGAAGGGGGDVISAMFPNTDWDKYK